MITVVALAACSDDGTSVEAGDGGGGGTSTTTKAPATPAPDNDADLVLQIRTGGGLVPVDDAFGAVPEFTLLADGRVIVTGPTTMEFPGAALPNLLVGTIDREAVRDAVEAAREAGVGAKADLGQPPIADAPTTMFVLVEDGRTTTLEAYALGGFEDSPGLSAPQQAARRRLTEFADRMGTVGAAAATEPYPATAVSVLVRPYAEPELGSPPAEPAPGGRAWPLADLATGGLEKAGGRCLAFTGADATKGLAAAGEARANTRWHSGDASWALTLPARAARHRTLRHELTARAAPRSGDGLVSFRPGRHPTRPRPAVAARRPFRSRCG